MIKTPCNTCEGKGREFEYDSFGMACAVRRCRKCGGSGQTEAEEQQAEEIAPNQIVYIVTKEIERRLLNQDVEELEAQQ